MFFLIFGVDMGLYIFAFPAKFGFFFNVVLDVTLNAYANLNGGAFGTLIFLVELSGASGTMVRRFFRRAFLDVLFGDLGLEFCAGLTETEHLKHFEAAPTTFRTDTPDPLVFLDVV